MNDLGAIYQIIVTEIIFETVQKLVWGEVTKPHKKCLEPWDRTLQDIRSKKSLISSLPVLFAGDFRQILSVILKGNDRYSHT